MSVFAWPTFQRPPTADRMLRPAPHDAIEAAVGTALQTLWNRPGGATDRMYALEALSRLHSQGQSAPLGLVVFEVHQQLSERRPPAMRTRERLSFDGRC